MPLGGCTCKKECEGCNLEIYHLSERVDTMHGSVGVLQTCVQQLPINYSWAKASMGLRHLHGGVHRAAPSPQWKAVQNWSYPLTRNTKFNLSKAKTWGVKTLLIMGSAGRMAEQSPILYRVLSACRKHYISCLSMAAWDCIWLGQSRCYSSPVNLRNVLICTVDKSLSVQQHVLL